MLTARRHAGQRDLTTFPLHPILAAAYPVLFLFATNSADQVTLDPLWTPLLLSIGGAVVALLVGALVARDWTRGALLATLAIALFFTFGHVWFAVAEVLGSRRWLVGAYALIGLAGIWLIWRGGGWVKAVTRFLNVVLGGLVLLNAFSVASFGVDQASAAADQPAPTAVPVRAAAAPVRDVYYLIFDRYGNNRTLQQVYGYDNTPFLDALRERGFYVAEEAWSNYLKTALSLTSSLDMEHLDGEALAAAAPFEHELRPINAAVRRAHAGPTTFQSLGYEYVHIGSFWEPSRTNAGADVVLNFGNGLEFSTALRETTALSLLGPPQDQRTTRTIYTTDLVRTFHEFEFDQLAAVPERQGPTFTFAHFLLPHPPYVYDADGSEPTSADAARPENERYVAQLQYTNQRILELVDELQDAPEGEEPVIILQADEGPYPPEFDENERHFQWLEASAEQVSRKYGILNALALPGVDPEIAGLHPRSSPVNALRVVLNAYFDADLPLLPDTVYLSPDYVRVYDFVPIDRAADGSPILPGDSS